MTQDALVQEVIASYMLRYHPVQVWARRSKQALKAKGILQDLDKGIVERASGVRLTQSDHNKLFNTLTYNATSGAKTYTVKIQAVPAEGENQRHYWEADLLLSCSCPFWRYGGCEHHANRLDYLYAEEYPRGTLAVPSIRDPDNNNYVCKHIYKALQESKRIYFDYKPKFR